MGNLDYNLYFLYAGILVTIVMVFHTVTTKRAYKGTVVYGVYALILISFLACVFDIADSVAITNAEGFSIPMLYTLNILLYLTDCALPFALLCFLLHLLGMPFKGSRTRFVWLVAFLYAITVVALVTTPLTGLVFQFDASTPAHTYVKSSTLWIIYAIAGIQSWTVLALLVIDHKYIRTSDLVAIGLASVLVLMLAGIQLAMPGISIQGFGAVCGALALYMSINVASGLWDTKTGALEPAEMRRRLALLVKRNTHFNVTYISIENRRFISNSLGPDAVDATMLAIADMLKKAFKTEQVFKFQGARFAVITLDDEETVACREVAESWLNTPQTVCGNRVQLDVNVMTVYSVCKIAADLDVETFLNYLVEVAGASRHEIVDPEMLKRDFEAFQDATLALENALANNSFEIFLQPLYTTSTGKFESAEVLSRLKGEDGNYIPPGRFISIAEENGTIRMLSEFQFQRLCKFLDKNREVLQAAGLRDVKYNVCAAELATADRGDIVLAAMKKYNLPPELFTFELTESLAYGNDELVLANIKTMHEAGSRVFMDDFGSGYANIESVLRLPFDGVKLDISLLRFLEGSQQGAKFYRGLVDMLRTLDKVVVSEGVETGESAQLLAEWGVDVIQGFYYSKPLPTDQYLAFVAEKAGLPAA